MSRTFSPPPGRRRWRLSAAVLAAAALAAFPAAAQAADSLALVDKTEPLGPGITLRHVNAVNSGGWYDSQILTVDLANGAVTSDLLTAGKVAQGGPLSIAADKAGAVAGINGEFFDIGNSTAALGGEVQNGQLLKSADVSGRGHIGVGQDGVARLVDLTLDAKATFGGSDHTVVGLNAANGGGVPAGSMVAFNSSWGNYSRARGMTGVSDLAEVLVRDGQVVSVNATGAGAGDIPDDGFVLVGREASAAAIRALQPGDPVTLTYGLKDAVAQQMKFALGQGGEVVRNGAALPGLGSDIAPRTAMGFKDGGKTLLLVTWDGPGGTGKGGVSITKEANDLAALGAETAVNLDGGGSTTMVARKLGESGVTVRNVPSDGNERSDPNGVGVFVTPGDGKVDDLVVTPGDEDAKAFPGLHRTLTAKAVDDHQTPVALARGDVRWSTSAGTVDSGLLAVPDDATGTIEVRSATDTAQAETKVRVLKPLERLELSTNRLSITDPVAANAVTLKVTGRDDQGFTAPVELADLDLDYDHAVARITPATGGGLKITPLKNGATILTLRVAGQTAKLPITIGVETDRLYAFDDSGAGTRWTNNSTAATTITNDPDGVKIDFGPMRNKGITAASVLAREVNIPGQPLRVRIKMKSSVLVPAGLTYAGFWDAAGKSTGLYGTGLVPSADWQYVTFTIPSTVTFPIRWNSFQGINTAVDQQVAGSFVFGGVEADVPTGIDLPAQDPLRADPLFSPDGKTNGKDDWSFATLSDVQFTSDSPELTKVGVAALERIRTHKPDLVVLNGDITDRGLPSDMTLARQTLERGGCDLIKVGEEPAPDSTPDAGTGKVPCYYVPGNHESYGLNNVQADLAPFTAEFGRPYRTFDHKGTRFVLLASSLGTLRGTNWDQLTMLQQALDTAKTDPSIDNVMVFAHHPVDDPAETKSSQLGDRTEVALVEKLLSDFGQSSDKGVSMVGSHAQIADVHRIDGVPYTVLPSSGKAPYGTPDRGGITGWLNWSVDRDATAGQQWLTADVRAFSQENVIDAPDTVEVSQTATIGGHIVQPSGVTSGSRVVPLAYPMSIHWSGDDALAIGSGPAAVAAARQARKVAILDPATRQLTALRTGTVKVAVTNDSMREYTDAASLAPIRTEKAIQVVAYAGPGPRIDAPAPVFPAQPAGTTGVGQPVTVTNTGDRPLHVGGAKLQRIGATPAGEFVLAGDDCTDREVAPGASCVISVRFSPSAPDVTSDAELVLTADTPDGQTEVALSGLSTVLAKGDKGEAGEDGPAGPAGPAGPKGDTGATGGTGATGPKGDAGATGAKGDTGIAGPTGFSGAKGDAGAKGDKGDAGANGLNGAKGDKGDKGATGAPGRDAAVKCSVAKSRKSSKVTCKVTYAKATSKRIGGRQASLTRGGRTYARGTVAALRTVRTVTRGTYTLRVKTTAKTTTTYRIAIR